MGVERDDKGLWVRNLRRMPKWALFLTIASFYTMVFLGKDFLTGEAMSVERIAITAASGGLLAAATFWIVRRQNARERKKPPGWPTATNFKAAIATGSLPEHALAEQWIPELTKTIRLERHMNWVGFLVFGGFSGLSIYLAIENPDHPWFWVLTTVAFACIALFYPIWVPRRREKLEALIAQFPAEGTS